MRRFWTGMLLLSFSMTGSAAEDTKLNATAELKAPHPAYGETAVTVKGTHKGEILSLNPSDNGYTWDVYGTLREEVFWPLIEVDTCSKSAGAQQVRSLTCETTWAGQCGRKYESQADTQISYPFLLGPGPANSHKVGAEPICNYTSGPLNPLVNGCETDSCTPIVINLDGAGFRFTSLEEGVRFDVDADGEAERLAWTSPNGRDAFLVLDRNGNGRIDDGTELFGGVTPQPDSEEPNGFKALAVFDDPASGGNGDGVLSTADSVYSHLGLWIDANHDALSQADEMVSLAAEGIQVVDLTPVISQRRDRHGNRSRWASHVLFSRSLRLAAIDVIFIAENQ